MKNGKKVKADGNASRGPRAIRHLRREGSEYPRQAATGTTLSLADFQKNFDDAIKKSLEQEKRNRQ